MAREVSLEEAWMISSYGTLRREKSVFGQRAVDSVWRSFGVAFELGVQIIVAMPPLQARRMPAASPACWCSS